MIEITESGAIRFDGTVVGEYDADERRLVLDLGWMRIAGLNLTVLGDPRKDKNRKVLERPRDMVRNAAGVDQEKLITDGAA